MKLRNLFILAFLAVCAMAQAQQMPKLPTDAKTKIGKLDNGLTYYIRHNEFPEHTANFYIAQRVGSIQENDDQRGLAHFLEHMAFNGSTHFKDNELIEYTRSLGVAFGKDLNAYTSIEQTVYNIDNVPTTRQTALDSCLLVLQDWSNGLSLLTEEIDKERGVIHGEWAMRNSAQQRMLERNLPAMYSGSKYGYRLPIGTMEVVDNFTPEALRAYYRKWYHPENQAIIVIGDIDVDHTEAMIKELFANIKKGPEAASVEPVEVPDNAEAIYIFDKDKEMQYSIFEVMLKSDPMPKEMKGTQMEYIQAYMSAIISSMFNARMGELAQEPDCPFIGMNMNYGEFIYSSTKDAYNISAVAKEGKEREALAALIREVKRVKEFGFNGSEFVRAKEEFMSRREKAYANRDKRKNTEYYQECVEHFLHGSAMPDADIDYQLWQAIAQQLPLEAINAAVMEGLTINEDKNLVCLMFAQEKDGVNYLTTDEMKQIMGNTRTEKLEAWVDNTKNEPLIAQLPKAGKIKSEKKNDKLGYTELTLSNGAKVILKKTDYKDNEVLVDGWANGGSCLYSEADYSNLKVFEGITGTFGLGNFNNNELEKALAGKQVGINVALGKRFNNIGGHSTPKDLETLMQLLYLHFTAPQKDEKAYNALMQQMETMLKNRNLQPEAQLQDSINAKLYAGNKFNKSLTVDNLKEVSLDRVMEIMKERFSNANNFTFSIIGNFDEQTIRPLICQYIASLPGKEKAVKTKDTNTFFTGNVLCDFKRKMETPKPYIVQAYIAKNPATLKDQVLLTFAGQVLSNVLLKSVREDAGAAYSVGAGGTMMVAPKGSNDPNYLLLQVYAPISAPEKQDLALDLIKKAIDDNSVSVDADIVNKVKADLLKDADINAKKNSYWVGIIKDMFIEGEDNHSEYKSTVESVTPAEIASFIKNSVVAPGNFLNVVMRPE